MTAAALPRVQAAWRSQAACTGLSWGGFDPWCPDDALPPDERGLLTHLARGVCATCPVRQPCLEEALTMLPTVGEESMRGGFTPDELRSFARQLERPYRLRAQCGTRSAYVAGCRCDDCRRAHRVYEHERRLRQHQGKPRRELTPRGKVAARLASRQPQTAVEIANATGLPVRDVRVLLAQAVAAGRVDVVGRHHLGLQYLRSSAREAAA